LYSQFSCLAHAHTHCLWYLSLRLIRQQSHPLILSILACTSETRPCKMRPPRTAILRAWNCQARVLRRIFVYISPIEYREFCDRIHVSHPVVQRSLWWRDIPRDFSFNIGVRSMWRDTILRFS